MLDNQESKILPWQETGYRYVKRQSQARPEPVGVARRHADDLGRRLRRPVATGGALRACLCEMRGPVTSPARPRAGSQGRRRKAPALSVRLSRSATDRRRSASSSRHSRRPRRAAWPRRHRRGCAPLVAGAPTISERSGKTLPSVTSALAPTRQPRPMTAPLRMVAPMPTRQPSPTVQPCRIALCPIVQSAPIESGEPSSECSTAPSWMLVRAPMRIISLSPRITALNQTLHILAEADAADHLRAGRDQCLSPAGKAGRKCPRANSAMRPYPSSRRIVPAHGSSGEETPTRSTATVPRHQAPEAGEDGREHRGFEAAVSIRLPRTVLRMITKGAPKVSSGTEASAAAVEVCRRWKLSGFSASTW